LRQQKVPRKAEGGLSSTEREVQTRLGKAKTPSLSTGGSLAEVSREGMGFLNQAYGALLVFFIRGGGVSSKGDSGLQLSEGLREHKGMPSVGG